MEEEEELETVYDSTSLTSATRIRSMVLLRLQASGPSAKLKHITCVAAASLATLGH
jgi:hypothetical protein